MQPRQTVVGILSAGHERIQTPRCASAWSTSVLCPFISLASTAGSRASSGENQVSSSYGACAASWYYFDSPPSSLSVGEAVQLVGLLPSPGHVQRAPGGGLDFEVEDGLGWLSRSHVINAQNRVPRHLEGKGFTPVEDAGVEGLAQDQPDSDDDCSEMPEDVAELIATEGTA
jgi:hypothetical protein